MNIKNKRTFIIDNSSHQCFREVNLYKEFSSAFQGLAFNPCITSPTGLGEYTEGGVSIGSNFGTESWKIINRTDITTFNKGEDEAIDLAKTLEGTWFMTSDKGAQRKCKRFGISFLDHIEFLFLMNKLGIINLHKAEQAYIRWGEGTNRPPKYPQSFQKCATQLKDTIEEKLKLLS
jgi:hypothetical protein